MELHCLQGKALLVCPISEIVFVLESVSDMQWKQQTAVKTKTTDLIKVPLIRTYPQNYTNPKATFQAFLASTRCNPLIPFIAKLRVSNHQRS